MFHCQKAQHHEKYVLLVSIEKSSAGNDEGHLTEGRTIHLFLKFFGT